MSKSTERTAADLQHTRDIGHVEFLREAASGDDDVLADVLRDVAVVLNERADHVEADRRKAWQSAGRALRAAAGAVNDLQTLRATHPPTVGSASTAPIREPIDLSDPAQRKAPDGTPSERAQADISVSKRRYFAAGAYTFSVRYAPTCQAEYRPTSWQSGARVVRCGKHPDHDGKHAEWIEGESPDEGGDWGPEWEIPSNDWPEGPITPDAATRVRLAIEAGADTDAKLDAAFGPPIAAVATCGEPPFLAGLQAEIDRQNAVMPPTSAFAGEMPEYRVGDTVTVAGIEFTKYAELGDPVPSIELADPTPPAVEPPDQPRPRLDLAAVVAAGRAAGRGADHRSHSQVTRWEECGTRYALNGLERRPSWALVGGSLVHQAIEQINRSSSGEDALEKYDAADLWIDVFDRGVAEAEASSRLAHPTWRAAAGGAEAYDWWRVNGQDMVDRWVEHLAGRLVDGWSFLEVEEQPVIEWLHDMPVQDCPVPFRAVLDLAMIREDDIEIIDIKAGKRAPDSSFQLGAYGWALWHALSAASDPRTAAQRVGVYWMARTGMRRPVANAVDLALTWPWNRVRERIAGMDRAERAGLYPARPSSFCGGCGVRDLCPAMA